MLESLHLSDLRCRVSRGSSELRVKFKLNVNKEPPGAAEAVSSYHCALW